MHYTPLFSGVRAGMFVRDAKARCPHLVTFPYDFEAYQEVNKVFYDHDLEIFTCVGLFLCLWMSL